MAFYRDKQGNIAKALFTDSHIIIMFAWTTRFFRTKKEAFRFLVMNGYC